MTPLFALLAGLTLISVISPLLTFATLFQQKEWRLDRLREHLRRDGWLRQLWGTIRPILVLLSIVMIVLFPTAITVTACMALFAGLAGAQIVMHKQRYPRPTSKALALFTTALVLNVIAFIGCMRLPLFFPVLVLLQPVMILGAWTLWKPIDMLLKKRVMNRAMKLRSQLTHATVIGIAGSVGKTTVKELIAHLTQDLHPIVTPAHVNTEMGVAQWILGDSRLKSQDSSLLIIEMGAYRAGEIALLSRIAQPTIGVMTALGSDHLALFGSEQNIIDANGELIDALPKNGHAFFYGDNAGCRELAKRAPCPVTIADGKDHDEHPLQGQHNDHNVALAVAVAKHLGINDKRVKELLQTFKPQMHTFSVKTERGVTILDDTYNISPLSFKAALDWAADQKIHPQILLTSGLQETGVEETRFLQELGAKAAKSIHRVIFTDKHGADIFAQSFGKPVEVLNKNTGRIAEGSLILAVGRMPLSTINRLLP